MRRRRFELDVQRGQRRSRRIILLRGHALEPHRWDRRDDLVRVLDDLHAPAAPSGAQLREHLRFRSPAQLEQQKRIAIERLAEHVVRRSDVLARIRPVRTTALGLEIARAHRKQAGTRTRKRLVDRARHLAREQLGTELRFLGHALDRALPHSG
jgi:hypothetical protein